MRKLSNILFTCIIFISLTSFKTLEDKSKEELIKESYEDAKAYNELGDKYMYLAEKYVELQYAYGQLEVKYHALKEEVENAKSTGLIR